MPNGNTKPDITATRAADELSIQKILAANEDGYGELYEKYLPPLLLYLPKFIRSKKLRITKEDTEDRASDALFRLFEVIKSGRWDLMYPIWPYLKTILKNACLNFWHKHYKRTVHFPTPGGLAYNDDFIAAGIKENDQIPFDLYPKYLHDIYFGPIAEIQQDQAGRNLIFELEGHHVDDFLAQLSPSDYDLFKLAYYEHKTSKEISKLRNVPEGTVRSRLSRALTKYRRV